MLKTFVLQVSFSHPSAFCPGVSGGFFIDDFLSVTAVRGMVPRIT
jgi:hypothetical protein